MIKPHTQSNTQSTIYMNIGQLKSIRQRQLNAESRSNLMETANS